MTADPVPASGAALPTLTRDIGEAERGLRRLLEGELGRAGLTFPEWTVLVFVAGSGSLPRGDLVARQLAGHVVPDAASADAVVEGLLASGHVATAEDGPITLTAAGEESFRHLRREVGRITGELFAGLPAADVEATRRTLTAIGERTRALLATPS